MTTTEFSAVITGLGVVSAFGDGCDALFAGMWAGHTAVRPVVRFSTEGLAAHNAALIPTADAPTMAPDEVGPAQELAVAWAIRAGREALDAAAHRGGERIGLVLGSNLEDAPAPLHALAGRIADALGVAGPRVVVSVACASSTAAVAVALDWLEDDVVDAVLVGGTDVITPRVFAGFSVLGALAADVSRPFSEPVGMSLGEGAAFVVLERQGAAEARGARFDAAVLGVGLAGDAHHPTQPAPDGNGVARALGQALADAGIQGADVGYVNAHGTGTAANDAAEVRGLARALGGQPAISSTKGLLGHAQGAAGMLELVVSLLARRDDKVPPTWGFESPRPGAPEDPVPGPGLRRGAPSFLASSSSAFGGTNAAVVVGPPRSRPARATPALVMCAWHVAGVHGVGVPGGLPLPLTGIVEPAAAFRMAPRVDPRRADPATAMLIAVVERALRDAGLRTSGPDGTRIGLVVGQSAVSQDSNRRYHRSLERGGLPGAHAGSFARALLVAPAGACAAHLGVRGPLDVLDAGGVSGLLALAHAAALLRRHPDLTAMVVAAVDETGPWQGAAAMVLRRTGPGVGLGPVAVGPSGDLADLEQRAGAGRALRATDVAGDAASAGLVALALAGVESGDEPRVITGAHPGLAAVVVPIRPGRGVTHGG